MDRFHKAMKHVQVPTPLLRRIGPLPDRLVDREPVVHRVHRVGHPKFEEVRSEEA